MSIKQIIVGSTLAALAVVLVPATGQADAYMSKDQYKARAQSIAQRRARIERSEAYRDKFSDMRKKRFKGKSQHGGGEIVGVPELDPNGLSAAATLLLGGVLVAQGRRRRLSSLA